VANPIKTTVSIIGNQFKILNGALTYKRTNLEATKSKAPYELQNGSR